MSEMERDPRVDAAWNTASREEPPVALDDAIRAAARKAVDAQPRRVRGKQWWYPFAAAATVAVIAIGLLQTTPPEQVALTTLGDAGRTPKQDAAATPASPPEASAPTTAAPATPRSTFANPTPAPLKKESPASEARRASAPAQSGTRRELDATDKLAQSTKPLEATESAAANKPAQLQASPPAAPAPRAEPFPAAPQSSAQLAPLERRDAPSSNANAMESAPARQPAAASSAAAPRLAGAAVGEQRAQRQGMLAKDEASAQPRAKTAPPRSVEDWIKLIRELRSEGRTDEARKEIVAFRSVYGEQADSLLPQDLREFAPPPAKQ